MAFTVRDIQFEVVKILGTCSLPEQFRQLTNAIEVLANTGEFDPLMGFVDLCVTNSTITLPREVDTVLSLNIGGDPAIGRPVLYRFHLNGPGDCKKSCIKSWEDKGRVPTFADLTTPSKLIASVDVASDANSELWVYGYDNHNEWIRTQKSGTWYDGYQVPTLFGYALPDSNAPIFSRVTRVRKAVTSGPVRLTSFDVSDTTGTLLGVFQSDETNPEYQRVKISCSTGWVRLAFRKRIFKISSLDDLVPLPAMYPVLVMLRAIKAYEDKEFSNATGYEATARRLLTEAVTTHGSPNSSPIQVNPHVSVGRDNSDDWVTP